MAFEDLAATIFVEILGMAQYPGAPFTGNIIRDLILFLFIPSVFIILFVYMIMGRLFSSLAGAQQKLRLLVGVALYLFIVASGYYSMFALLAGPYFLFLIFILGLVYFIPGHFGFRHEASGHYPASVSTHARGMTRLGRIDYLKKEIARYEANLKHAQDKNSKDEAASLRAQVEEMRDELYGLEHPWEKRR